MQNLDMDVSKNNGKTPQIIHFNRVFPYKPSILGVFLYFWKHPYLWVAKSMFLFDTSWLGSLRFAFRLNWKADGRTVPLKSGHLRDWFGHDLEKSLEIVSRILKGSFLGDIQS